MRSNHRTNPSLSAPPWRGWFRGGVMALLALAVAVAPALAQNTITGSVVDGTTQRPLPGAQVVVDGTELGGLTDNRGRFLILRRNSRQRSGNPTPCCVTGGRAMVRPSPSIMVVLLPTATQSGCALKWAT